MRHPRSRQGRQAAPLERLRLPRTLQAALQSQRAAAARHAGAHARPARARRAAHRRRGVRRARVRTAGSRVSARCPLRAWPPSRRSRPRLLGAPSVRALHWVGGRVLLGTRAGELLQLDYSRSVDQPDVVLLLQGHCPLRQHAPGADAGAGALAPYTPRGVSAAPSPAAAVLAAHPVEPLLASAGSDLSLRFAAYHRTLMLAPPRPPPPPIGLLVRC